MQQTSKVARFFELLLAHQEVKIKGKISKARIVDSYFVLC